MMSDISERGCEEVEEEGQTENSDEKVKSKKRRTILGSFSTNHFTPSTFPSEQSFVMSFNKTSEVITNETQENEEDYDGEDVARKLNFNKENEPGFSFNIPLSNNQMGVFSSFGKGVNNLYNINQSYFLNAASNPNSKNFAGAPKSSQFNKFSHIPFNFNSDAKSLNRNCISMLTSTNNTSNHSVFSGNPVGISKGKLNENNLHNGLNNSINMYGKIGWVCISCKNFNYESKNK